MLKRRIKKWDLDRNHKQADMLCALGIAYERESQGKKTAFLIRGRVVSFEEVQHYFRRKGVRDPRSLLNDAVAAMPTTRIDCHTPEPSSVTAVDDITIIAETSYNRRLSTSGVIVIPDPNQVDRVLRQSPELSQLDQLLHCGRDYNNSVFERQDWQTREKSFDLSSLETFYHKLSCHICTTSYCQAGGFDNKICCCK
jgi:hypothetical protein